MDLFPQLINSLLPRRCRLCFGSDCTDLGICEACFQDLPRISTACTLCATPMPKNAICGKCAAKPTGHSAMHAAFRYEFPIDVMIQKAKFQQDIAWLKLLSELMKIEFLCKSNELSMVDYILPVPLHPTRLRQRGFNQSYQLIEPLAREMGISIRGERILQRIRNTESQSLLDRTQRRKNIKNAFQIMADVKGDRILIVDDIVSTGSTVNEIAGLLNCKGAAEVTILCFARNIR